LINKPSGVVTATEDKRHETVIDLLPDGARKDIFPVGRLDIDTEGLILLTNNGALAHKMLAPKSHVDKKYYAKIHGTVTEEDVKAFKVGFKYDEDLISLPATLEILASGPEESEVYVTIHEGKFHQIKKMFIARGMEVTYLKRVTFGPLTLPEELSQGDCRELNEEEMKLLEDYI
jgi:16S rRNA pseudouridine516 synthase